MSEFSEETIKKAIGYLNEYEKSHKSIDGTKELILFTGWLIKKLESD